MLKFVELRARPPFCWLIGANLHGLDAVWSVW